MTKEQEHLIEHIDALKRDKHIIESLVTTAADIGQRVRNLVPRTGTPNWDPDGYHQRSGY
jgi:hypothetical protein